jgi:hypothetical protein
MAFNLAAADCGSLFINKGGSQASGKGEDFLIPFSTAASYAALFSYTAFSRMDYSL